MLHAAMASACVILKDQHILLMKHGESTFAAGKWSIIGGRGEPGETTVETVRREVREEAGLTLTQVRHAGHLHLYQAESDAVTSLSLYVSTEPQGKVRGSHEGEPVWVPLGQVDQLDLVGYLRMLLPHLLTPQSFVTGTMLIGPDREPLRWSLDRHSIAGTESLAGWRRSPAEPT